MDLDTKPIMVLLSGDSFPEDSEVYQLFDYIIMKPLNMVELKEII